MFINEIIAEFLSSQFSHLKITSECFNEVYFSYIECSGHVYGVFAKGKHWWNKGFYFKHNYTIQELNFGHQEQSLANLTIHH